MHDKDFSSLRANRGESEGQYDEQYSTWKRWNAGEFGSLKESEKRYFSAELGRLAPTIPATIVALEVGFGNGAFLRYAQLCGWEIRGSEVNEGLLAAAAAQGFDVIPEGGLVTVPDATFDLIVAFDVLEHIPRDRLVSVISEYRRMLKPGGTFLARFPNGDSPLGLVNQNGDLTHVTCIGTGIARYLSVATAMRLVALRGEAQPLPAGHLLTTVHRILRAPFVLILRVVIGALFFPKFDIDLLSRNLVMVLRKE